MTEKDWVDLQIRTSIDAGELLELLDDPAVQGSWEEDGTSRSSRRLFRAWGCIPQASENERDGWRWSSRLRKGAKEHNP
jgi:hypothetical protein